MTKNQYNRSAARVQEQLDRMDDLQARGVCAFCPEHLHSETTSPIDLETDYWIVKDNDFPYDNTTHHKLLIPKIHRSTVADLPTEYQADFLPTVSRVEKMLGLTSYALAMRSGDMHRNGGTVDHIHAHIVVGDTESPDHKPVRFKMSSRPEN